MEYGIARKSDLEGILSLFRQLHTDDQPIDSDKTAAIWNTIESNDSIRYFIAREEGSVVAVCAMTIIPNLTRDGKPFAVIENVVTDSSFRRRGIGAHVIKNALQYAKEKGCYKVVLLSNVKRTEAHSFYASIGFNGSSKKGFEFRF